MPQSVSTRKIGAGRINLTQMLLRSAAFVLILASSFDRSASRRFVSLSSTACRAIFLRSAPLGLKTSSFLSMSSSSSEVDAATAAASTDPAVNPNAPTFFDKLVSKEIPSKIIYEDDLCQAFRDINPQGPVHFLVIPKNKDGLNRLSNAREDQKGLLGHLMYTAQLVARQEGLVPGGFRLVINDGPDGAQSVYHLHIHIIGGRQMTWPPG